MIGVHKEEVMVKDKVVVMDVDEVGVPTMTTTITTTTSEEEEDQQEVRGEAILDQSTIIPK